MSDTVTPKTDPTAGLPLKEQMAVDGAIKAAVNAPDLLAKVEVVSPTFAAKLTGTVASVHSAPWGGAAIAAVAWASSYFGFGWSSDFDAAVVAAGFMAGAYAVPYVLTLTKKV
jgi:hypothetical protein